jgi:hypothetical protein
MKTRKLSELVLDFDLYPRASIDTHHAAEMQKAVEAGAKLPPIIICKRSKRIADGVHRYRVYVRLFGLDFLVEVIEKGYKTDADLFLDAVRYNASHGLRMDTHDKTHCILRAKELHISATALAGVLNMDPKRIGELRETRTATAGNLHAALPIKRTIQHMAGKQLTKPQVEANERLSGMHQTFYVNQVITLIENDLLDTSDEVLMDRLKALGELIAGVTAAA